MALDKDEKVLANEARVEDKKDEAKRQYDAAAKVPHSEGFEETMAWLNSAPAQKPKPENVAPPQPTGHSEGFEETMAWLNSAPQNVPQQRTYVFNPDFRSGNNPSVQLEQFGAETKYDLAKFKFDNAVMSESLGKGQSAMGQGDMAKKAEQMRMLLSQPEDEKPQEPTAEDIAREEARQKALDEGWMFADGKTVDMTEVVKNNNAGKGKVGKVVVYDGAFAYTYPTYEDYQKSRRGEKFKVHSERIIPEYEFDPAYNIYVPNNLDGDKVGNKGLMPGMRFDATPNFKKAKDYTTEDYTNLSIPELESKIDELAANRASGIYSTEEIDAEINQIRYEILAKQQGFNSAREAFASSPQRFRFKMHNEWIAENYPSEFNEYLLNPDYDIPYDELMAMNPLKMYFGNQGKDNGMGGQAKPEYEKMRGAVEEFLTKNPDGNYVNQGLQMGDYDIYNPDGNVTNPLAVLNDYLMRDNAFSRAFMGWVELVSKQTGKSPSSVWENAVRDYIGNIYDNRADIRAQKMQNVAQYFREEAGPLAPVIAGADDTIIWHLYRAGENLFSSDETKQENAVIDEALQLMEENLRRDEGLLLGYGVPIVTSVIGDYGMMKVGNYIAKPISNIIVKSLGQRIGAAAVAEEFGSALSKQGAKEIAKQRTKQMVAEAYNTTLGRGILSTTNFTSYMLMQQAASDLHQGEFSGMMPYVTTMGKGVFGGLGIVAAETGAGKFVERFLKPTTATKGAAGYLIKHVGGYAGLQIPTWVEGAYAGEWSRDDYLTTSMLSTMFMYGTLQAADVVVGKPATRKVSEKTILDLQEKGYGNLAADLQRHSDLHLWSGDVPFELSDAGMRDYRKLEADMQTGNAGTSWENYSQVMALAGYGTLPPGPSKVNMVEKNGEWLVQLADDNNRAIFNGETFTDKSKAEAKRDELAKEVSKIVEARKVAMYDTQQVTYGYYKAARAIADKRNADRVVYDQNGQVTQEAIDYHQTAQEVFEEVQIANSIPESQRTPEQVQLLAEYTKVLGEMLSSSQSSGDIRDALCKQYGCTVEEFEKARDKEPSKRKDSPADQAVKVFNQMMADGFKPANDQSVGKITFKDGTQVDVYNKIDLNEDGTPVNSLDILYYKDLEGNLQEMSVKDNSIKSIEYDVDTALKQDEDIATAREAQMESLVQEYMPLDLVQMRELYNQLKTQVETAGGASDKAAQELLSLSIAAARKGYKLKTDKSEREVADDFVENTLNIKGEDKDAMVDYYEEHPLELHNAIDNMDAIRNFVAEKVAKGKLDPTTESINNDIAAYAQNADAFNKDKAEWDRAKREERQQEERREAEDAKKKRQEEKKAAMRAMRVAYKKPATPTPKPENQMKPAEVPEAKEESAPKSVMPMKEVDGKQEPDYEKATPSQILKHIYEEKGYSKEQADEMVQNELDDANANVEAKQKAVQDAQARLEAAQKAKPKTRLTRKNEAKYNAEQEQIKAEITAAEQAVATANQELMDAIKEQVKWEHVKDLAAETPAEPKPLRGEGGFVSEQDRETWNKRDPESAPIMEQIAQRMGLKVATVEMSPKVRGYIKGDTMYLNSKYEGSPLGFVMGHEMTHDMENADTAAYQRFHDMALNFAKLNFKPTADAATFDEYVQNLSDLYWDHFFKDGLAKGMSNADAAAYAEENSNIDKMYKEIVADEAGKILADPKRAVDMLNTVENVETRRTIKQRLIDWIDRLLGDSAYAPKFVQLNRVKNALNDAFKETVAQNRSERAIQQKAADDLQESGVSVDTGKGDAGQFSVDYILEGKEREKAIKDLMKVTGRSEATVKKWLKAEESLAKIILSGDNAKFLDLQADESVPSIWKNSDYPQGTVEFSNICRKRLPFTVIYQKLQEEFPNRVFDASTLEDIRQIMKENGEDVACGLCFVEDRRQLLGEIGDGFIKALKGEQVEFIGEDIDETEKSDVNKNQQKAIDKLRESGDTYIPNLYELLTLDGMKELRKTHPAVAQAFIEYNNARGMQAGRLFQAYSAYQRDILKWSKAKIQKVNDAGGLRVFSFSDFEAHHLIDLVQVLTDCAAKGIKVQGYTKVPEFAKAVMNTKAKINRSLIAKGKGYVDADYVPKEGEAVSPNVIDGKRLLFDTVEGIDVNHPDFFDATGNRNVGNILVGISDEQIRLAMLDPFVDYIIPFHSGLNQAIRDKKGIGDWTNYRKIQVDKQYNEKGNLVNAGKHGINIYTDVLPRGEELIGKPINTVRDFQRAFFKVCAEKGLVPRFSKFINKNKKGEYVYTPGYEKTLIDFKLFDKNGKILPQEAVVPVFDNEFNKQILDKYVEDERARLPYDDLYAKVKEGLGLEKPAEISSAEKFAQEAADRADLKEGIKYSLVGSTGAERMDEIDGGTRIRDRRLAEVMEEDGEEADTIKFMTGWERGADGKWRYEIPDIVVKDKDWAKKSSLRLGDFVDAPELFTAYPDLADILVRPRRIKYAGLYDPTHDTITIDRSYNKDSKQLRETVAHEIQHAIQHREGFARGGSSAGISDTDAWKAASDDVRMMMLFGKTNSFAKLYRCGRDTLAEIVQECLDEGSVAKEYVSMATNLRDSLSEMSRSEFNILIETSKRTMTKAKRQAEGLYDKIAGEVEARNVEKRLWMSDTGRTIVTAESTEDVPRSEQIVKFSLDPEYMGAVQSGDMEKAQRMVDKSAEDAGYTIRGEHGTTHKFTIFNYDFANMENSFGKGHYFTNNKDDAKYNYASDEGADLTNRIELMAEQMESWYGYEDMSYEERKEEAKKRLNGGENRVISAALRMENPAVFSYDPEGKYKETFFDFEEPYDEENDVYGEPSGLLVDFTKALRDELNEGDYFNADRVDVYKLFDVSDGYTADQLKKACDDMLAYVTDDEGAIASNEIFKNALKRMGFDGIIDNAPSYRFKNMGLGRSTKHFIVFDSNQIKQTDPVTYDDNGNVIPLSERFNPKKQDIRYSLDAEQMRKQQESKNFKNWFGDWQNDPENSSKVVDEDGRPLVVYHGTKLQEYYWKDGHPYTKNTPKFYTFKSGFFSPDRDAALQFAGRNESKLYTTYLDIKKPLVIDAKGQPFDNIVLEDGRTVNTDQIANEARNSGEYDGVIIKNVQGEDNGNIDRLIDDYIPFYPEQIKSATENNGDFSRENPDIRYSLDTSKPTFYSNAERAVENIKQNKATAEQWLAMIKKNGGLKSGEDKWMGLSQWLEDNKGKSLTKDEVLQFIRDNGIQMEEVEYGRAANKAESVEWAVEERMLKEGESAAEAINYLKEYYKGKIDLGKSHIEYWKEQDADKYARRIKMFEMRINEAKNSLKELENLNSDDFARPLNPTRLQYTTEGLDNKREIAFKVPSVEPYQEDDSIHFGPENEGKAVMWVRFGETTDADGNRVLVIDEIQSNRHQDAREKGYRMGFKEITEQKRRILPKIQELKGKGDAITNAEKEELNRLQEKWDYLDEQQIKHITNRGIPAAPFEKNWHEVAMKRMLRLAAEEGFDKVAWTTGAQQAERYDLSSAISGIEVRRDAVNSFTGKPEYDKYNVWTYDRNGNVVITASGQMEPEKIIEVFGKDLGNRILETEEGKKQTIDGEGLSIGGSGMKGFYDQMLPRFMDKYGKRWGVKTGTVELPNVEEAGRTMHAVDVTPEMKESVMQGQPLFSLEGLDDASQREYTRRLRDIYRQGGDVEAKIQELDNEFASRRTPPAVDPDTGEPLPRTDFDRPSTIMEMAVGAQLKAINSASTSDRNRRQAIKSVTKTLRDLANAFKKKTYDEYEENIWQKISDLKEAHDAGAFSDEEYNRLRKEYEAQIDTHVSQQLANDAQKAQRDHDRNTVEQVVAMARDFIESGLMDNLTRSEVKNIMSRIKDANGKTTIGVMREVDKLFDLLLKHQEKRTQKVIDELLDTPAVKINQQGVKVQGKIDADTARLLGQAKEYIDLKMSAEDLAAEIASIQAEYDPNMGEREKQLWNAKLNAALLANNYASMVSAQRKNIADADNILKNLKELYKAGELSATEYREQKRTIEDAIREYKADLVKGLWTTEANLREIVAGGKEQGKTFFQRIIDRANDVKHWAYRDLEGVKDNTQRKNTMREKAVNTSANQFVMSSMYTFNTMLREFGRKATYGQGYLFDNLGRTWVDNASAEWKDKKRDMDELNAKAHELFGNLSFLGRGPKVPIKVKWHNLIDILHKLPSITVNYKDGREVLPHVLDQAQAAYIYAANKQTDGAVKLRAMGISEADVERIKNELDQRVVQLVDWLQSDFLPKRQQEYNAVYERMYGTPMTTIENYFPLEIDKKTIKTEQDNKGRDRAVNASTVTSSVKERKFNTNALDIWNSNIISLVSKHLDDINHWKHFAEWNRDLNVLLNDPLFRRKVENYKSWFGSGETLWNHFRDTALIASGDYLPVGGSIDKTILNAAKMVSAAKVSMRFFTGTKQALSFLTFVSQSNPWHFTRNLFNEYGTIKWCFENMPLFQKRWMSRRAGDARLVDTDLDWSWTKSKIVKWASKWGLTPNAAIDLWACAIGSRSVYDTRMDRYLKMGYDKETAHQRAIQDAQIAFNESQQSSEGMFLSPLQVDRTATSVAFSVFRTSPFGFTRLAMRGTKNIKQSLNFRKMAENAEYMYKKMTDKEIGDGLTDTQARNTIKGIYRRQAWRGLLDVMMYAFGAQAMWNIGSKLPQIAGTDDDEKRMELLKTELIHAGTAGAIEGFPGGNLISNAVLRIIEHIRSEETLGEAYEAYKKDRHITDETLMPIVADCENIIRHTFSDEYMTGLTELFDLAVQVGIGVNPKSFSDMFIAVLDRCNGDVQLAKESLIMWYRLANVPQSQVEDLMLEEVGLQGLDKDGNLKTLTADDVAERYVYFRKYRRAPFLWELYNSSQKRKIEEKYENRFYELLEASVDDPLSYRELADKSESRRDTYLKKYIKAAAEQGPDFLLAAMNDEKDEDVKALLAKEYVKSIKSEAETAEEKKKEAEAAAIKEAEEEKKSDDNDKTLKRAAKYLTDPNDLVSYVQLNNNVRGFYSNKEPLVAQVKALGVKMEYTKTVDGQKVLLPMDEQGWHIPIKDKEKRAKALEIMNANPELFDRACRANVRNHEISRLLARNEELFRLFGNEKIDLEEVAKNTKRIIELLKEEDSDHMEWKEKKEEERKEQGEDTNKEWYQRPFGK